MAEDMGHYLYDNELFINRKNLYPHISDNTFYCIYSIRRDIFYFIGFVLILVVIPPIYYTKLEFIKEWVSSNLIPGSGIGAENLTFLASSNQMLSAFVVTGMMMYMFIDTIVGIATGKVPLELLVERKSGRQMVDKLTFLSKIKNLVGSRFLTYFI